MNRRRGPVLAKTETKRDGPLKAVGLAVRDTLAVEALENSAGAERPPAVRPHPREPALITHGSGTTGLPRLAVHCANTMWNRLVPQKALGTAAAAAGPRWLWRGWPGS